MPTRILRIDTSPRCEKSQSRDRADILIEHLSKTHGEVEVTVRDVSGGLPIVDRDWIAAKAVAPDEVTPRQAETLALSLELIEELEVNDIYVFSIPIYNFQIPASLKAWIDLVCMPKRTFRYTEDGPEGLLESKRALLAFASGGTEIGSEADHASPYMEWVLGFIGVTDVSILGGKGDVSREALIEALAA